MEMENLIPSYRIVYVGIIIVIEYYLYLGILERIFTLFSAWEVTDSGLSK